MEIKKTESEYNMKSIRFLLLTITTMFIIIGALMVVLGLSVYGHYHDYKFFYDAEKTGRFFTPSIICVLIGMLMLIVTCFGFFGSLKQSTCLVNIYAVLLSVMLVGKLIVVIITFTMQNSTIMSYINIPVYDYGTDEEIQGEIDAMQTTLNCCGGKNYLDYMNVDFGNASTITVTTKVDEGELVVMNVPSSCCAQSDGDTCSRLRSTGCQAALLNLVVQNASVIGVLGISVMFIQALGIIFALLLARCIRRMKSEKALMSWRIREQMIMSREADVANQAGPEAPSADAAKPGVYITRSNSSVA